MPVDPYGSAQFIHKLLSRVLFGSSHSQGYNQTHYWRSLNFNLWEYIPEARRRRSTFTLESRCRVCESPFTLIGFSARS